MDGTGPTDHVSGTGTMRFDLDNSAGNSGGLLGYYSPGHTNCRTGFIEGLKVRAVIGNGTYTKYLFYGTITEIRPVPGKYLARRTAVVACDYMDVLAKETVDDLAIQIGQTGDQVLTALLAAIKTPPLSSAKQVGPEVFAYAAHQEKGEKTKAITVCQKIAQSDLSYIGIDGSSVSPEWMFYKNRNHRYKLKSQATLTDAEIYSMSIRRDMGATYNSVTMTMNPATVDTSPVVLGANDSEIGIASGETIEIRLPYRDPNMPDTQVSGFDLITPVEDVDYKMSSTPGGGSNLNYALTVTMTEGASEATLSLENTGQRYGYINLLQIRGYGIYVYEQVLLTETSGDADRPITINLPYQSDPSIAKTLAARLLTRLSDQHTLIESVSFVPNTSVLEGYAINVNIMQRILISETVSGVTTSEDYFTVWLEHWFGPNNQVIVTWGLDYEPDVDLYWELDSIAHSALDVSTYLI